MDQTMYSFIESTIRRAGDVLLDYYRKPDLVIEAKGAGDLVTEADRASETSLIAAIRECFPDYGIVSEESGAEGTSSRYVWLLDPLEATYNFSRGLPMWGINMALSFDGEVQLGAFFDPLLDELYYAERSAGASRNGLPLHSSGLEDLSDAAVYCSRRKYIDLLTGRVRKLRHIGSIGNALAYVAAGHLDGAIEVGGGLWDYAVGGLLVQEVGGVVSTFNPEESEGSPAFLAAATPALHAELERVLSGQGSATLPTRPPAL